MRWSAPALLVVCAAFCTALVAVDAVAQENEPATDEEEAIEVTVVGRAPIDASRDPTAASFVLRGAALERPGSSLPDVIERVPGVQVTRAGGAADLSTTSVRGASTAQTPVYLAGVRLDDELTGTVDLSTLPLWMLDRVEIYRGSAPVGADKLGMGGAIFLEPRIPRDTRVRLGHTVGSFGERGRHAALSFGSDDAGALIAVRHARGDGDYEFLDDRGTRFDDSDDIERRRVNADHDELDVWTIGRLRHRGARLTTMANAFVRSGGAPGLQLPGAVAARYRLQRMMVAAAGDLPCQPGRRGCNIELSSSLLSTRYRLDDPLHEHGAADVLTSRGDRLAQRLRVRFHPFEQLRVSLGGGQERSLLATNADATPIDRAKRQLLRGDADALLQLGDDLQLVGVVALECHTTTSGDTSEACAVLEPVGRLGARVQLARSVALLLNAGRYVRVPTLGELFGISVAVRGNSELEVEEGYNFDLGVSAQHDSDVIGAYGQLMGFARVAEQLIVFRRSSLGVVRPYNAASARVVGLELATGLQLWRIVHLGAAVTLLDPRDITDGRVIENDLLPFQSQLTAAPFFELVSPPWRRLSIDRATIGVRYHHRSERIADPAGLIVLDETNQLDLDATLELLDHVAVRGRLSNLLDQRSFDLLGYPLPGRAVHGMLEGWW